MRQFIHNEIDSDNAKNKLSEILRRAAARESFTIMKRGQTIAELTPGRSRSQHKTCLAIDAILKAKQVLITDSALNDLKADGRE